MDLKTGGEIVIQALEKLGVEYVFGIPGIHNLDIYESLMHSPIRDIPARHEQGAGFMADGYARITGKPGVAIVITGPGLTNIITAMGQAYHDSVPMLVISSQIETSALPYRSGYLHELKNSTYLVSSVAKESRRITDHAMIEEAVFEAWNLSLSGRPGPVHIEIPLDILGSRKPVRSERSPFLPVPPVPDVKEMDILLEKTARSCSPLILAGGGARGYGKAITLLAEALSAPVVQTCAGKGTVSEDHPLCIGTRIHFPNVESYVENCDLVLALGTEFSPTDFWKRSIQLGRELVSVNTDTSASFNQRCCNLGIRGDVGEVVRVLLRKKPVSKADIKLRTDEVAALKRDCKELVGAVTGMGEELPSMLQFLNVIRDAMPEDGLLWADMTGPAYVGISEFPVSLPRSFLHPVGFGTLGMALPAAIGSKIAFPDKAVCVLAGDGGFQFTLPELAVAADLDLNIPIVLWNDCGYGEIRRNQNTRHPGQTIAVDHKCTNYAALSEVYGIKGKKITSMEELAKALGNAFNGQGPTILDVREKECF